MKRRGNVISPIDSINTVVEMLQQTDSSVEDGETVWVRSEQSLFVYRTNSGLVPDNINIVASLYGNGVWQRTSTTGGLQPILQHQNGTPAAPLTTLLWSAQPVAPVGYPPFQMVLSSPLFSTTFDPALTFGANAGSSVAGKPVTVLAFEQDFESVPGTHQSECYFQSESTPGVDPFRPFGFVRFLSGPDVGKVSTAVNYRGAAFTIGGGPIGGPGTEQATFTDAQLLFTPASYVMAFTNGATIDALAGRLTLTAPAGDMVISSLNPAYLAWDNVNIAKTDTTVVATWQTSSGALVFLPTTDNTGQLGSATKRWSLVRATTITSGDLHLLDEERGAHWTLREQPNYLEAVNEMTKKTHQVAMRDEVDAVRSDLVKELAALRAEVAELRAVIKA